MTQRLSQTLAGSVAALLMTGWAAGAGAQVTSGPPPSVQLPPLPPAASKDATQPQTEAAPAAPAQAAAQASNNGLPPVPIGHDGIREIQTQLISLGFDPGPVDGEAGPATQAAVRKYNENRGGTGSVPIDGALLTRLRQDTAPRLTPEQVAARSQPRYQAQAPARAPADPVTNTMQKLETGLRGLFNGGN